MVTSPQWSTHARLLRLGDEIGFHGLVMKIIRPPTRETAPGVLRGHVRLRVRRNPHGEHDIWMRPDDAVEILSRDLPPGKVRQLPREAERLAPVAQKQKQPKKGQLKLF